MFYIWNGSPSYAKFKEKTHFETLETKNKLDVREIPPYTNGKIIFGKYISHSII
jgi:hypothetical protein